VNLGNLYQTSGRLTEATQQLEESVQLYPSPVGYLDLVGVYSSLGETEKLVNTVKTWSEKIPSDGTPHLAWSNYYASTGDYDNALAEAKRAVELESAPVHFASLTRSYFYMNRLDDAKATAEKAIAEKQEHPDLHYYLYVIAHERGDQTAMVREAAYWKGSPFEYFFVGTQGGFAAAEGRLREAETLYKRSVEIAAKAGSNEVDRFRTTAGPLYCLFGNCGKGIALANEALKVNHNRNILTDAAVTFAAAGDSPTMESLLTELTAKAPNDAFLQKVNVTSMRALAALQHDQPEQALDFLKKADPYKNLEQNYLKGLAHAKAGRAKEAAGEFQYVIDHHGLALIMFPVTYEMAHLQIARAYSAMGNTPTARQYYEKFLGFFKNADSDLPLLKDAHAELAKLPH
jgi:tetratricopeptide (TPR) repeat protein